MTREELIAKSEACRDEVLAVLKKYDARLVYHTGSSYGKDRGGIELPEARNEQGWQIIPVAELPITIYDWSM